MATALARRGFKKGDVFAIYSPNLPEYAIVFHAVASLGGTVTTVNPLYMAGELASQLKDCRARLLITVPMFLDKAREAAAQTGVEDIYVFGTAEGARSFSELLDAPPTPPPVAIDPVNDVVALPYSSGTTGLPKGVMLTHRNLVANLCQCQGMENWECFGEGDTVLAALPYFHIYGMVVIMKLGLANGATIVSVPRFDFQEFLGIVQPTPEQLSAALAGGVLVTPTGSTQVRGVLPQAARAEVRSQLEPDLRTPTVDERAFAQLPLELQSLLGGMPPREALLKVQLAQQHLIALGNAYGSSERLRAMVQNVLAPQSGGYTVASFSAGTTSFPPMSPLVSPYLPATR